MNLEPWLRHRKLPAQLLTDLDTAIEGAAAAAQAGPALAHGRVVHRLRPEHPNHVWAYDFMSDRTHDGRAFRLLAILDEYTRECLAIVVGRRLTADDVLATLTRLFVERGVPAYLRSDNGPEFATKVVRGWLHWLGAQTRWGMALRGPMLAQDPAGPPLGDPQPLAELPLPVLALGGGFN